MPEENDGFRSLLRGPEAREQGFAPFGRKRDQGRTFAASPEWAQRKSTAVAEPVPGPEPEEAEEPEAAVVSEPGPDLDALVAEAHARGVAEARAEATAHQAELMARIAELEAEREALGGLMDGVQRVRSDSLARAARDVGELTLAVVRRVVGDCLAVHPDALVSLVEQAIAALPDDEEVVVRVPVGFDQRVSAALGGGRGLRVVPDPDVSSGCIVETTYASIEASLEAAMEGVEAAVDGWLSTHPVSDDLGGGRGRGGRS